MKYRFYIVELDGRVAYLEKVVRRTPQSVYAAAKKMYPTAEVVVVPAPDMDDVKAAALLPRLLSSATLPTRTEVLAM